MKIFNFVFVVLAALAMLVGGSQAAPKGKGGAIIKGGKAIKHGLGAIGAIGTGQSIYEHIRNRHG